MRLTGPRRLDVATALREAVEDHRLRIPPDDDLRRDLHSVRAEAGPTGAPRLVAERSASDGHADRFWSLALACGAAAGLAGPFDGEADGRASAVIEAGFGAHEEAGVDGAHAVDHDRGLIISPSADEMRHYA